MEDIEFSVVKLRKDFFNNKTEYNTKDDNESRTEEIKWIVRIWEELFNIPWGDYYTILQIVLIY